jgi:small-conductance mechanosensitive channel
MESQLASIPKQKIDASNSLYYAQNQLSNANYQLSNASSSVQSLRNSISEHRNQYNELTRRNAEINSQIEIQNRSNSSVSSQIQSATAQINSIRQEIASKNQIESQKRTQIETTKQSSRNIDTQIQNLDKEIRDLIISSDNQQRAILFADCYSKPELQEIARAIEKVGFDLDYLAYLAIKQNNSQLVRFAIEKDIEKEVDFTSTSIKEIGDKTLLQYAAQKNYTDIVNLILSQGDISLIDTLLNAMNQNDLSTIAKIFAYENGKFASMKIFGHTLLHIAIDAGQKDVVEKILEVCNGSIKDITDNGDSALKLAIRTKNMEMINIVAKKLDIETEALSFIQSDNLLWLDEIIKYQLWTLYFIIIFIFKKINEILFINII